MIATCTAHKASQGPMASQEWRKVADQWLLKDSCYCAVVESRCFSPIAVTFTSHEARNTVESRPRFTIQLASSPYDSWSEKQLAPRQRLRSEIEMSDCHVDSIELCVPKLTSKANLLYDSRSLIILEPAIFCFSVFAIPRVIPIEGVIEIPLGMYNISATCRVTLGSVE